MQPPQALDDAKAGLVEVLDRAYVDQLIHRFGEVQ